MPAGQFRIAVVAVCGIAVLGGVLVRDRLVAAAHPGLPMPVQNEVTVEMLRLEDAKRLARENPVAVANILRAWMEGES